MSFLSVLGSIGKGVGKVALGVTGGVLNTATGGLTGGAINANMFDHVQNMTQQGNAVTASLTGGDTQNRAAPSLLSNISDFFYSASGFLSGRTHVQADLHTAVGGTRDDYNYTNSGLPSWLLPAGIAAVVLYFMSSGGGRRR